MGDANLSEEVIEHVFSYLPGIALHEVQQVNTQSQEIALGVDDKRWKAKVTRIEAIMYKFGDFIPLPSEVTLNYKENAAISPIGVTQQMWVEVMGSNPSYFREKRFCPDGYQEIVIRENIIGMCSDFPVEQVIAENQRKENSDEEFFEKINKIYLNAGFNTQFRRQTMDEFFYAYTMKGENPDLRVDDPLFFKKITPYYEISDRDPSDLSKPSPSGEKQPRPLVMNAPNLWGFRRSGVEEWTHDTNPFPNGTGFQRVVVTGSYLWNRKAFESQKFGLWAPCRSDRNLGASRLIRITQKGSKP